MTSYTTAAAAFLIVVVIIPYKFIGWDKGIHYGV
jgi:hypothetical protein